MKTGGGHVAGKRGHGEGSIYQTERGRWRAQITLESGKRVSKTFATRRQAQHWLVEALKSKQDGLPVATSKITVAEFLDHWFADVASHTLRPRTLESYEYLLRRHIKPALGEIRLTQLRPDHLQKFYSQKLEAKLSPRTVQYLHAVLHRSLKQAVRWGLIPRNPADLVDAPRPKKKPIRPLNTQQVSLFLKATKGERLYPLYVLAIFTGMRLGEILGLHWEDVDLEKGQISVTTTLQFLKEKGPIFSQPKSQKSRRTIVIPEAVVEVLKEHKLKQEEEKLLAGSKWEDFGLVFCTSRGTPLSSRNLLRYFQETLRKVGLPKIRFHDLRHTTATLLLVQGVHPKIVQELLGHSQISVTLDTYSHVMPGLQREAMKKMEEVVSL
jgi:integrase